MKMPPGMNEVKETTDERVKRERKQEREERTWENIRIVARRCF